MRQTFLRRPWWRLLLGLIVAGLVVGFLLVPRGGAHALPSALLPDLHALPAEDIGFGTATIDGELHTVIRLSTITYNDGVHPLDLRADPDPTPDGKHRVWQHYTLSDGAPESQLVGEFEWHDGHSHFHLEDYATYSLYEPGDPAGVHRRDGSKTTFCVMDTTRIDTKLPGAPKRAEFRTCGADRQGMSIGWGDRYSSTLIGQWIDVDDLTAEANGTYILRIVVNPDGKLQEVDGTSADNTSEVTLCIDFGAQTIDRGACGDPSGEKPGNGRGRPPR